MKPCTIANSAVRSDMSTRRDFLKTQLKGAFYLAAGASGLWLPRGVFAGAYPDISVVTGAPGPAARAAVDALGGMKRFVKPGQKVVIKPNMSFGKGQAHATNTDAGIVRELAVMCLEASAGAVRILDHPTGFSKFCIEDIRQACDPIKPGMVAAIEDADQFSPVSVSDSWIGFNEADVMKEVLSADVLIAAPKAKEHETTGVSLSMKGMMGLVYDRQALHGIARLDASIVKLATRLKPQLVVVDATRVLSTNGPHGPGDIIAENKVIASADMVAADAMTVKLCTWNGGRLHPGQIDHIKMAHEAGLGRMDVENLQVKQIAV
ncbi:MAG: DUF362 domain-containing protein [Pseudomonadota bacterium]